jgi:peptidoglycan/LPS O-acetylase OafA/YrhL
VFFNVSTYEALQTGLSTADVNRLIWAPDVFGCACFLIASALAGAEVRRGAPRGPRRRRRPEWWIAAFNLAGSVAFGVAGIASYIVPDTGDVFHLAAANFTTVIGALCFLAGALLMLLEGVRAGIPGRLVPARA